MIVRRPQVGEREILEEGQLDLNDGLVGDSWKVRSSRRTADGSRSMYARNAASASSPQAPTNSIS